MDSTDPRKPTRDELVKALGGNQRVIKAFEQLFDRIPSNIIDINVILAELSTAIGSAQAAATQAEAYQLAMQQALQTNDAALSAQLQSLSALLSRLTDTVELLAVQALPALGTMAAQNADMYDFVALAPRAELGTMAAQQAERVAITGGAVTAQLRNNQTILLETTAALANGAAAAAATLLNAPVAGNPTKWIAINDNGTTRQIPAW